METVGISMRKTRTLLLLALSAFAVSAFAQSSESTPALSPTNQADSSKDIKDKKDAEKAITSRLEEMRELRKRTTEIIGLVAELTAKGVSQSDSGDLRSLTEELKKVSEKLALLEEEIEAIKGWIEGQNEALPIMSNDIIDLKRFKPTFYGQFQYRRSSKAGSNQASFNFRRIRLGFNYTVDPRTSVKLSYDFGTGTGQNAGQLRDAFFIYDVEPSVEKVGTQIRFGQQPIELGYELLRSSSERELPERSLFNQRFFNGERSQGIAGSYGLNENATIIAGIYNSLTYGDPEQTTIGPNTAGRRPAVMAALRTHGTNFEAGISGFAGSRPKVNYGTTGPVTAPEIKREFIYFDASYVGLLVPNLAIRGEYYTGKDRNNLGRNFTGTPLTVGNYGQVSVKGWQLQATYSLDARNQIVLRMDELDPNTALSNNNQKVLGIGYLYYVNPGVRFSGVFEEFNEAGNKYKVFTIRTQYKF